MKIVSWNCNGGFRKKTDKIDELSGDILIVQECENPKFSTRSYRQWAGEYVWIGENKNKGLGIFSRNGNRLRPLDWQGDYTLKIPGNHNKALTWKSETLQSFLPCAINDRFTVVGVWTKHANSPNFGYIGQLWLYLQIHGERLKGERVILCGDLNSNAIWDEWDRWWNHSDVVTELAEIGIKSLYHYQTGLQHGREADYTFYLHRKREKPYHIDYAFLSQDLLEKKFIGNLASRYVAPA